MNHDAETSHISTLAGELQEKMRPEILIEKLQLSRSMILDLALYAGIGFLAGFLMRRFALYLVACVVFVVVLVFLQEAGAITIQIHWNYIFQSMGIQLSGSISMQQIIPILWEWIRMNMLVSITLIIGFLLGLQIGK